MARGKRSAKYLLEPWISDDEERYQRLLRKQVTLADTALGRPQEAFKSQMISKIATMSEEEWREMRKVLDDCNAAV
jgi:hypothetical protein